MSTDRQAVTQQTNITHTKAGTPQTTGRHRDSQKKKKRIDKETGQTDKETGQTDSHDRLQRGTDSDTIDRQNRRHSEHEVENLNLDSSWLNNSTGKGKCFYFFLSLIGHQCIIADLELITKAL